MKRIAITSTSTCSLESVAATASNSTAVNKLNRRLSNPLAVTSRKVVWLFPEQLWFDFVPFFHRLQGRLTAQG